MGYLPPLEPLLLKEQLELHEKQLELQQQMIRTQAAAMQQQVAAFTRGLKNAPTWRSVTVTEVPMRYYLLAYEPKTGGGPNLTALAKALKTTGVFWSYLDRVWVVGSTESADALWKRVTGCFGKNDNVLIIELPAAPDRQGWLPEKAWEWFNEVMPRDKQEKTAPAPQKLGIPYSAYQDSGAVLVVPNGIRVRTVDHAESVFFTETPPAERQPPRTATKDTGFAEKKPETKPETSSRNATWQCGFCGHEAPADMWKDGDCPRCGITR